MQISQYFINGDIKGAISFRPKICASKRVWPISTTNAQKYSSDRDTLRVECKSAVFHADFLLLRLSRFGNSTGSDASS